MNRNNKSNADVSTKSPSSEQKPGKEIGCEASCINSCPAGRNCEFLTALISILHVSANKKKAEKVAGIITIGLGLWLLWDPVASDFFTLHSSRHGSFQIVGWLLMIAGVLMTFVGCCGCCGAWKMSQGALVGFFVILVVVFCLEVAAAYIAYSKQDTIQQYIEDSMYDTIRNRYTSDANYKSAFDAIQQELECCGVKTYLDWLGASWDRKNLHADANVRREHGIGATGGRRGSGHGRTPFSCCNNHGKEVYPTNCGVSFIHAPLETYAEFLHSKGCADALHESIYHHLDMVIAICVIVGAIQLLAMFLSMVLCCCISTEKRKYDY